MEVPKIIFISNLFLMRVREYIHSGRELFPMVPKINSKFNPIRINILSRFVRLTYAIRAKETKNPLGS
jgi:hypothetical protein